MVKINKEAYLKFDYYYNPSIQRGIKQATTRLADDGKNIKQGEVIECRYNLPSLPFYIIIKEIETFKFNEISNNHALFEGYLDKGLLKQVLKSFYPEITKDTYLKQYRFKYIGDIEDLEYIKDKSLEELKEVLIW